MILQFELSPIKNRTEATVISNCVQPRVPSSLCKHLSFSKLGLFVVLSVISVNYEPQRYKHQHCARRNSL